MTDLYARDDEMDGEISARRPVTYDVFNPEHSVGVACDLGGEIVGLYLGEEVRDNTESWLAAEILLLARLAYKKSQVGRRAEMLANGTLPSIVETFGLPTPAQYTAMENAAFDR